MLGVLFQIYRRKIIQNKLNIYLKKKEDGGDDSEKSQFKNLRKKRPA